jgi:hypothetical protein
MHKRIEKPRMSRIEGQNGAILEYRGAVIEGMAEKIA